MEVRTRARMHRPGHYITCYYCNAILRQNILREHMEQCPDVPLGCPNKCGVTVKRALLPNHLIQECVNKLGNLVEKSYMRNTAVLPQKSAIPNNFPHEESLVLNQKAAEAKNDIQNLKLDIHGIGESIGSLDQELQFLHSYIFNKQDKTSSLVQEQLSNIQNEMQLLRISIQQQQENQLYAQISLEQRLEEKLNSNAQVMSFETDRLLKTCHAETEACRLQLIQEIHRIQEELDEKHTSEINQLQCKFNSHCEYTNKCQQELKEFRKFLSEENVMISGVWKETLELVNKLTCRTGQFESQMQSKLDDFHSFLSDKNVMINGVWLELKKTVEKLTERLCNLEEKINMQQKEITQLRQDMNDCIESQAFDNCTTITNGHLIWKISHFEQKLDDAKKNGTILYSPVFYSAPFGYKLRVQVRLNGIGQWTGRHMIASLQVLQGEWDSILPSPFNQQVTLILHDQCKPPDKMHNLKKTLVEGKKKEEPAGLHVFIPHTILKQHNYIINNTIFLEVSTQPHS